MQTPRANARGVPMGLMTVRCLISKALHLSSLYKSKIVLSVAMAKKSKLFQLFLSCPADRFVAIATIENVFLSFSGARPPPSGSIPSKVRFCSRIGTPPVPPC